MAETRSSLTALMPGQGKPVEFREVDLPELEPDSALLRVELSEVCGTDVHLRDSRLAGVPYPIIPGHVSVGTIEKIRGQMLDIEGRPFAEGDRVTFLDVHRTCHACWYCLVANASTRCPKRKVYGITYGLQDGLTGGWSQYLYLKPGVRVIRMDGVESELYMAGGCSLPTALHAVERADIALGDTVLVLGSGPVGLSTIAFALLRGAAHVFCIGAPANRLQQAQSTGADAVLDFTSAAELEPGPCTECGSAGASPSPAARQKPRSSQGRPSPRPSPAGRGSTAARREWVLERTRGRGADVTIECTGAPSAVTDAMRFTRDAGRVVIVGQYTDHGETSLNPHLDLNKKHLDVRGCWGSDYSHFHRAVEMLRVPRAAKLWDCFKLTRYSLGDANDALSLVEKAQVIKALIDPWK